MLTLQDVSDFFIRRSLRAYEPRKYYRLPEQIEAIQYRYYQNDIRRARIGSLQSAVSLAAWSNGKVTIPTFSVLEGWASYLHVQTLQGLKTLNPGDYLIKTQDGDFFPCAIHVFEERYSPSLGRKWKFTNRKGTR